MIQKRMKSSMNPCKHPTKEQLISFVSLHKAGQSLKDILSWTLEQILQKWIMWNKEDEDKDIPRHRYNRGRPKKAPQSTTSIIWQQVEASWCVLAREVKTGIPFMSPIGKSEQVTLPQLSPSLPPPPQSQIPSLLVKSKNDYGNYLEPFFAPLVRM